MSTDTMNQRKNKVQVIPLPKFEFLGKMESDL